MKFDKLQKLIIQFFLFLIPLFFLPVTRDFFDFNKNFLLFVFALILVFLYCLKSIFQKRLVFYLSPLDLPILFLLTAVVLSLIVVTPNKIDSLINPLGSGTFFALIIVYFLLRQFSLSQKSIFYPLIASGAVLGLISLLQFTQVLNFLPIPEFYKNKLFTPAGSLLSLLSFLFLILLVVCFYLYQENNHKIKMDYKNVLLFAASLFIVLGVALSAVTIAKKENRPIFLPYSYGWSIGVETLKKPLNGLFGVGPANFVNSFTSYKPAVVNQKEIWNVRFGSSSNLYLQVLTELGILGFAALLFLLVRFLRLKQKFEVKFFPLFVFTVILFIPANFLLLFVLFLFLGSASQNTNKPGFVLPKESLVHALSEEKTGKTDASSVIFLTAPFIVIVFLVCYLIGRAFAAEFMMSKGIVQAVKGNAQLTYDLQKQAVNLNPQYSTYRLIFSQTNFALALLVSQKKELTQDDQQTLVQLVTQAINNAKIAINLNPGAATWENLAEFYKRIMTVNEQALGWSATAYNQAIVFDPANPLLRVVLGQLYYSVKLYDLSIRQFEIAVSLKDDFANGWYNLANAYREDGKISQSRLAYEKTLALVDKDANANDYDRVQAELDALPKEPEKPVAQAQLETLTSPASPSAEIKKEVELNEEEVAPEVFLTPSPLATESSTFPTP